MLTNKKRKTKQKKFDPLTGCGDHILGYTFDIEGPSIFSESSGKQELLKDLIDGIVYWEFCPICGHRTRTPNL